MIDDWSKNGRDCSLIGSSTNWSNNEASCFRYVNFLLSSISLISSFVEICFSFNNSLISDKDGCCLSVSVYTLKDPLKVH